MAMKSDNNSKVTLDDILAKRNNALSDVRASGNRVKSLAQSLFEPPKADGRISGLLNNFDRFMAIYDGIMLGTKIVGSARRLLRRR